MQSCKVSLSLLFIAQPTGTGPAFRIVFLCGGKGLNLDFEKTPMGKKMFGGRLGGSLG